jgi:hypothetical protein
MTSCHPYETSQSFRVITKGTLLAQYTYQLIPPSPPPHRPQRVLPASITLGALHAPTATYMDPGAYMLPGPCTQGGRHLFGVNIKKKNFNNRSPIAI